MVMSVCVKSEEVQRAQKLGVKTACVGLEGIVMWLKCAAKEKQAHYSSAFFSVHNGNIEWCERSNNEESVHMCTVP